MTHDVDDPGGPAGPRGLGDSSGDSQVALKLAGVTPGSQHNAIPSPMIRGVVADPPLIRHQQVRGSSARAGSRFPTAKKRTISRRYGVCD